MPVKKLFRIGRNSPSPFIIECPTANSPEILSLSLLFLFLWPLLPPVPPPSIVLWLYFWSTNSNRFLSSLSTLCLSLSLSLASYFSPWSQTLHISQICARPSFISALLSMFSSLFFEKCSFLRCETFEIWLLVICIVPDSRISSGRVKDFEYDSTTSLIVFSLVRVCVCV